MKTLVNYFYFWSGLLILFLAKMKHRLQGYRSPRPFAPSQLERCIEYDLRTVSSWLRDLAAYTGKEDYLKGRKVLELGPGPDLGVGLMLLAEGAAQYMAVDANDLATRMPPSFYERLFLRISNKADVGALRRELAGMERRNPNRLHYVVRRDFDLVAALEGKRAEVIFSQASFEHFDDIHKTIEQLSLVAAEDAVLVMSVDLRTHSRWIRDRDPNNIYRYPGWLYRLMDFDGIPNRVRPREYEAALARNGWSDIVIKPLTSLTSVQAEAVRPHLHHPFRSHQSDMHCLTISLFARREAFRGRPA